MYKIYERFEDWLECNSRLIKNELTVDDVMNLSGLLNSFMTGRPITVTKEQP